MKIINTTPHPVNVRSTDGGFVTIWGNEFPSRASIRTHVLGTTVIDGHPVEINRVAYGDVEGLPDPQRDTFYIVSRIVAEACPDRVDLLVTGKAIRNGSGSVVACEGLRKIHT
ncbi:MAG: hypothetical protein OXG15_02465 [Gammaproteobacteria bacterium]|nr:hypothetical protein [Gammaproteobacteria bacterium]